MLRQSSKTFQVVDRQKIIDEGKRGDHAPRQRLIVRRAEERVQPDQSVAGASQPCDFVSQQLGISTIPSIGDYEHNGAMSERPASPQQVESSKRFSDSCSAGPVVNVSGDPGYRPIGTAAGEFSRDTRQPRRKKKGLATPHSTRKRVHEMKQDARIPFHG